MESQNNKNEFEWLKEITKALPQLMWTCMPDGPCDYLSNQWVTYTGIPEKDQLGYGWLNQLHPDDIDRVINEWNAHTVNEKIFDIKFRIRRHDGIYRSFHTKAIPIHDKQGRLVRWLGSNTDIQDIVDAHKKIDDVKTRLEIALESSSIGIWEWKIKENELIWDDQMYKLYGIEKDSSQNNYDLWASSVHPDDLESASQELQKAIKEKINFESNFRIIKPNGNVRYLTGKAKIILNNSNEVEKLVGTNWDITEIKENEYILREARDKADKSAEAKSKFLSTMSHEIRTPLNGIVGFCEILKESRDLTEKDRGYVDILDKASNSLMSIINSILEYSRIESGMINLNLEEVDVYKELIELKHLFNISAKKDVILEFHIDDLRSYGFLVDLLRLRQILTNLVGNSIKFTNKGKIKLEVTYSTETERLNFLLQDTGCGIPEYKIGSIFEAFVQSDSTISRKYGGSGLGLSITKNLLELLNGGIECESEVNKGTTFKFYIHAARSDKFIPKRKKNIVHEGKRYELSVLVVDDNEINRQLAKNMLEKFGCSVETASDGVTAIDLVAKKSYKVVFMDINMPELDGYTATKKIRLNKDISQPKIYALSANAFEEDKQKSIENGMNGHLSKPFKKADLIKILESVDAELRSKKIA